MPYQNTIMNNIWSLPESLNVGGSDFQIRTDFRAILDILNYFEDPEYEDDEKMEICKRILYPGWREIPIEHTEDALKKAMWFISGGEDQTEGKPRPKVMDWEQDAPMIIPAINKILGKEIRSVPYMHWWTFLGSYMEIGESLYTAVLSIRQKKSKGKKLDKAEQDFYRENKKIIDLKVRYSNAELKEQEKLKAILDG